MYITISDNKHTKEISVDMTIDIGEEYDQKSMEEMRLELIKFSKFHLGKAHKKYIGVE